MIYHKLAKIRFFERILEELPEGMIIEEIKRNVLLMNSAKTKGEREVAKLLVRRWNDLGLVEDSLKKSDPL